MSWQMCNGWFVEACASIDVDCIDDLVCQLRRVIRGWMGRLILPGGRKEETTIRSEGQPPKERGKGLVLVDVRVPDAKTAHCTETW